MKFDLILFDKLLFSILITFYVLCVHQFVHVVDIVHTFGSVELPGSQKQHPLLCKTQQSMNSLSSRFYKWAKMYSSTRVFHHLRSKE